MRLSGGLDAVGRGATWETLRHLRSVVGLEWVREALTRTGTATIRRRKLPNEVVVWLVIGMALFRDLSIDAVVKRLGLARHHGPGRRSPTGSPVTSAAVANARSRVGPEPVRELFDLVGQTWRQECEEANRWRGLSVCAADGTTLRIPDTPANAAVYGRPGSGRSKAAYPQARVVAVLAVGSRLVADFVTGAWEQGEQSLARPLVGHLPDHSLLILDRGFVNYAMFAQIPAAGTDRHFLCRAKKNLQATRVRAVGRGDTLVELAVPAARRKEDPTLPATIVVRLLDYRLPGFRPARLLTSLLDPEAFPAQEVIALYHKRWEIELAYDELKTHTLERRETIRSKQPDLVVQEICGLLLAYNLVRLMMARAAHAAGVEPCRMSFRNSLVEIRAFFVMAPAVSPGNLPRFYRRLCENLVLLVLPTRRPRRYPRVVKIKMSNFKRKDF